MPFLKSKLGKAGLIFALAVFAALSMATVSVAADKYPARPVTVIIPYSAGGTADVNARAMASLFYDITGQPLKVVNRPGGGTAIGAAAFLKAKPNGYTIWYGSWTPICVQPHLGMVNWTKADFVPVCNMTDTPLVMTARADAPFKNLKELVAYAKKHPGKVRAGTLGAANAITLMVNSLELKAGIKLKLIPYGGGAETSTALLAGNVDLIIQNPVEVMQFVEAGKFRYIAVAAEKRQKMLPGVPTFMECGYPITVSAYKGIYVRKGTKKEYIDALAAIFKKISETKSFKGMMKKTQQNVEYLTGSQLAARDQRNSDMFKEVIANLGLAKKK